ncbi:MAG: hypothetical protein IJW08_03875 [Lentisphaeria bacterium]|nr:hypothetical protein [Lentisphaeria bacterium]
MKQIIMPHEAVGRHGEDFCQALYWRYFPIMKRARNYKLNGKCGNLCSLRFAASRPAKKALPEKEFLYDHLLSILDAAQYIAESNYVSLHINKAENKNILFALAMFENEVSVEIELNEALPDTMPDIAFLWANFDAGCVTNQPLIGYLNYEGLLQADASGMRMICKDSIQAVPAEGPYEWMKQRFLLDVERDEAFAGNLNTDAIAELISRSI